jgi:hypothetical protein
VTGDSWFFEIALVFVRLDHVASFIVNENQGSPLIVVGSAASGTAANNKRKL